MQYFVFLVPEWTLSHSLKPAILTKIGLVNTSIENLFDQITNSLTAGLQRQERAALVTQDGSTQSTVVLSTSQVERPSTARTPRHSAAVQPGDFILLVC